MVVMSSHWANARPLRSIEICGAIPVMAGPVLVSCAVCSFVRRAKGSVYDYRSQGVCIEVCSVIARGKSYNYICLSKA